MRKKIVNGSILLIIILVIFLIILPRTVKISDIKGSYASDENPRTTITFASSNSGEFYYYYNDSGHKQKEAKGTFFMTQNGEYKIKCKTLSIEKCKLNGKVLTINIEGKTYKYVKNSNSPVIIIVQ